MFLKDDQLHQKCRLSLGRKVGVRAALADSAALIANWRQTGGLLESIHRRTGIEPHKALAVWSVESGRFPFVRGRPVLRLESHVLWERWGRHNAAVFDRHFRFGGHGGVEGLAWTNHHFRKPQEEWKPLHVSQDAEYEAFGLATLLAGLENACLCSSFGGPQVMGFNHGKLGYPDASSLYRAFAASQRAQVLGFFDFCTRENLLPALQKADWHAFAQVYNGPARVDAYAEKINDAWKLACGIVADDGNALARAEEALAFDHPSFAELFSSVHLKHFAPREFLFRGRDHSAPASAAYGLNAMPPRALWQNILPVARVVDAFRAELGAPVTLQGIYRTQAYNTAIGGAPHSQHTRFAAVDLRAGKAGTPADWARLMRRLRDGGLFTGAVGIHAGALHIDTRGENLDFDG
jgi:hypothetical protein